MSLPEDPPAAEGDATVDGGVALAGGAQPDAEAGPREAAGGAVVEAGSRRNWALIIVVVLLIAGGLLAWSGRHKSIHEAHAVSSYQLTAPDATLTAMVAAARADGSKPKLTAEYAGPSSAFYVLAANGKGTLPTLRQAVFGQLPDVRPRHEGFHASDGHTYECAGYAKSSWVCAWRDSSTSGVVVSRDASTLKSTGTFTALVRAAVEK